MEERVLDCLTGLALSGLNGDCMRIATFVAGSGKQCRLSEIETALNLRKRHVSTYCKKLYEMQIFKRFTLVEIVNGKKHTFPLYSINWDYKYNKSEVQINEAI